MVDPRDLALQIAVALQTAPQPEPLGVDLWNQSPEDTAFLVKQAIDECNDAGVALARVRIDRHVAVAMRQPLSEQRWCYRDVAVEVDAALFQRVAFHRST